jgi:hypothetical protein
MQQSQYLMADETPILARTKDKPGLIDKIYYWSTIHPLKKWSVLGVMHIIDLKNRME